MGKVVATYLVRVTLRERDDHAETDWGKRSLPIPDPGNDEIAELVSTAIYDGVDYFGLADIHVTSERTDV